MQLYLEKDEKYFSTPRVDLINLIPFNPTNIVLEIGSGGGDTLVTIKQNGLAAKVVGVELMHIAESNQNHPFIDDFIFCNIETTALPYPPNFFDVIICGDVLEHLIDPWLVVEKISKHLKEGGVLIASFPNIRKFNILYDIIVKGDFKYENSGILDKTHLRFFCKKNMMELLSNNGMKVIKVASNLDSYSKYSKTNLFNLFTFNSLKEFLVTQFYIVACKNP